MIRLQAGCRRSADLGICIRIILNLYLLDGVMQKGLSDLLERSLPLFTEATLLEAIGKLRSSGQSSADTWHRFQ